MKARVKATGEIIDETAMVSTLGNDFYLRELEPILEDVEVIDYWTRLEHQYAGMAMQGILSNQNIGADVTYMVNLSTEVATALVEKLKGDKI